MSNARAALRQARCSCVRTCSIDCRETAFRHFYALRATTAKEELLVIGLAYELANSSVGGSEDYYAQACVICRFGTLSLAAHG